MIEFDELWGVYLISWFPGVVTFGVPFPFNQILESFGSSMTSVVNNSLHFILLFAID